jgi:hypothetical protein
MLECSPASATGQQNAIVKATVFGIIPCVLGVGFGQYLRWSGTIWLTDAERFLADRLLWRIARSIY